MSRSLWLLLCLSFVKEALTLTCYTSNVSSLLSGNLRNFKHKLQDCRDYINELPNARKPVEQVLHCFTIVPDYMDVVSKGCIPEGECQTMIVAFKDMIETSGVASVDSIGNVHCEECDEDACNSEDEDVEFVTTATEEAGLKEDGSRSGGNSDDVVSVKWLQCAILFWYLCYVIDRWR